MKTHETVSFAFMLYAAPSFCTFLYESVCFILRSSQFTYCGFPTYYGNSVNRNLAIFLVLADELSMLTGLPTGMCDVLAPHSESGVLLMDYIS